MKYMANFAMERDERGNTDSSYVVRELRKLKGVTVYRSASQYDVGVMVIVDRKALIPKVIAVLKDSRAYWVDKSMFRPYEVD